MNNEGIELNTPRYARWRVVVGGCIFLGLAVVGLSQSVPGVLKAFTSGSWPQESGRILSSTVQKTFGPSNNREHYEIEVIFDYKFQGKIFSSDTPTLFGAFQATTEELAIAVTRKYVPGSHVIVWVNPKNPSFAVLTRHVEWWQWAVAVCCSAFVFLSLGIIFSRILCSSLDGSRVVV